MGGEKGLGYFAEVCLSVCVLWLLDPRRNIIMIYVYLFLFKSNRAYLSEFDVSENVELVILTSAFHSTSDFGEEIRKVSIISMYFI